MHLRDIDVDRTQRWHDIDGTARHASQPRPRFNNTYVILIEQYWMSLCKVMGVQSTEYVSCYSTDMAHRVRAGNPLKEAGTPCVTRLGLATKEQISLYDTRYISMFSHSTLFTIHFSAIETYKACLRGKLKLQLGYRRLTIFRIYLGRAPNL